MDREESVERSPRGQRMIDSRKQFELLASLYERALLREKAINGKLISTINSLRQKYEGNK